MPSYWQQTVVEKNLYNTVTITTNQPTKELTQGSPTSLGLVAIPAFDRFSELSNRQLEL